MLKMEPEWSAFIRSHIKIMKNIKCHWVIHACAKALDRFPEQTVRLLLARSEAHRYAGCFKAAQIDLDVAKQMHENDPTHYSPPIRIDIKYRLQRQQEELEKIQKK